MKKIIYPSIIEGIVNAPPSKSAMQRACALALLNDGKTTIHQIGISNDDKAALAIIEKLGATIQEQNATSIILQSKGIKPISHQVHCGESGLSIRMFTPLIALSAQETTITGEGSLMQRPMNFFDECLPQLNVKVKSNEGKLPLIIKGILEAKNISIDGSLSSQFLTGLIFAFVAAEKKEVVTISVKNLKSKPYIDLSLDILEKFGVRVKHHNYEKFFFMPNEKIIGNHHYTVEGDWSGVAFLLVSGAISGAVQVRNLDINSTQGDKKILQAIKDAGAKVIVEKDNISVHKNNLKAFEFDATDCPDLFPPLVALATRCVGTSILKGVKRLEHKESNRGLTLQSEFQKLGYKINLKGDIMEVYGNENKPKGGGVLSSHHDHRIAMAITLAALNGVAPISLEQAEAINKSYPNFYDDMKYLGARIENE